MKTNREEARAKGHAYYVQRQQIRDVRTGRVVAMTTDRPIKLPIKGTILTSKAVALRIPAVAAFVLTLLLCLCSTASAQHPAVVRVRVSDGGGVSSMGSGVYVKGGLDDQQRKVGIVLTNCHVVRDRRGPVNVAFQDGFSSDARVMSEDSKHDLAALLIWGPSVEPMPIAEQPPQTGEQLRIIGFGGSPTTGYLEQQGRAKYEFMGQVLTVAGAQARQGDSGGGIVNEQYELVGVLNAAGGGFTIGADTNATKTFLAQYCGPGGCYGGSRGGGGGVYIGGGVGVGGYRNPPPQYPQAPAVPQQPPRTVPVNPPAQGPICKCDPNTGKAIAAILERLEKLEQVKRPDEGEIAAQVWSAIKSNPQNFCGPAGKDGVSPSADEIAIAIGKNLDIDDLAKQVAAKLPKHTLVFEGHGSVPDKKQVIPVGGEIRIPATTVQNYDRESKLIDQESYQVSNPIKLRHGASQ